MIKLTLIVLGALMAAMFLPGILAGIAGVVFIGALFALLISGIGSLISFLGSTAASVLGGLFSALLVLAAIVFVSVSFPFLLLLLIPVGLVLLLGGLFCTVVFGVV